MAIQFKKLKFLCARVQIVVFCLCAAVQNAMFSVFTTVYKEEV